MVQDQDHDGMIDMKDLTLALSHAGVDLEKQGEAFTLEGKAWFGIDGRAVTVAGGFFFHDCMHGMNFSFTL